MLRLIFIYLLLLLTTIDAVDYHKNFPKAWETSSINQAAIALYGKLKFSTIEQTPDIELATPKALVEDSRQIPVHIRSSILTKSVAVFVDKQDKALLAVFHTDDTEEIDLSLNIRMERKGTLFVVIETTSGVLYYKRAFIDVLCLPCLAK